MDVTAMMRVGAVGNAFCAFSKDLVGAFCASTGPAASTRRISSSSPDASGLDPMTMFIEASQPNRSEMQIPETVIDGLEADLLMDQHGADGKHARWPGDGRGGADTCDLDCWTRLRSRRSVWESSGDSACAHR